MARNPMTGSCPLPGVVAYDVFMSHASEDKRVVGAVVERLRACGLTVWYDETHITGTAPISSASFA